LLEPECNQRYRRRAVETRNRAVYEIPPLLDEILRGAGFQPACLSPL